MEGLLPWGPTAAAMSEAPASKEAAPAECPVCYERFQPLEATQRRLSCGHTFCHDCLVKCLLSAKLGGHVQSSIVCPVCRFVTFLSRKKVLWLPRATDPQVLQVPWAQLARREATNTLEVPLAQLARSEATNTLEVPLAQLARSEATNTLEAPLSPSSLAHLSKSEHSHTLEVSLSPSSLSQLSKNESPNTLEVSLSPSSLSQRARTEPPNTLEVPLSPSFLSQLAKSEPPNTLVVPLAQLSKSEATNTLEVPLSPSSLSQLSKSEPSSTLEVSLSPWSLSQLARSEPPNTLVVPSHFVLPEQSVGRVPPGAGLAREAHIFVISQHGMPLLAAQRCGSGLPGSTGGDTASTGSVSVSSSPALGLQCCQSPMALAVMLVLTVAMLAAVLPWLLLVRRDL
uniref:RING-type domain-containing protein n=1 Tax=Junco hyemalis TaxID=40217 RepID=A0A8C5NQC8_JUNHY